MRVLVIGGGGREHALCWKLRQSPLLEELYCAPGNPGIAEIADLVPRSVDEVLEIADFAASVRIDLAVVGPELPLALGIADELEMRGVPVFGPRQAAAEIEGSKVFAKEFMARHGIPTAAFEIAHDEASARAAARRFGFPVVLKADGLAAGKGVTVALDRASAETAVGEMMVDRRFGDAGSAVVIEEYLRGREASFFVLTDGVRARVLPSAEDHKRAFDGDGGPNTGGMGAFAASPLVTEAMADRILDSIVEPALRGLRGEGRPYRGFLYCGLMITDDGPKVVEFNARLGDPEAQVVLPALDEDLLPHLWNAAGGAIEPGAFRVRPDRYVGVVLASGGYPGAFETGKAIAGLDDPALRDGAQVFYAGVADRGGALVTAGGRVLTVVAGGAGFAEAREAAYAAASRISFEGMHYRRDIGVRAIG